jgi:hypothetical protein
MRGVLYVFDSKHFSAQTVEVTGYADPLQILSKACVGQHRLA